MNVLRALPSLELHLVSKLAGCLGLYMTCYELPLAARLGTDFLNAGSPSARACQSDYWESIKQRGKPLAYRLALLTILLDCHEVWKISLKSATPRWLQRKVGCSYTLHANCRERSICPSL